MNLKKRGEVKKLRDKIMAIRNGKQSRSRRQRICGDVLGLLYELVLCLCRSLDRGTLNQQTRCLFEKLTRAEILCWLLRDLSYALCLNMEKFGCVRKPWYLRHYDSPEELLHRHILRLTREEVAAKYGSVISSYDYPGRVKKVYPADVAYAQFLRDHGLGHRPGANLTKDDLPPINWDALHGADPFAKREVLLRASALF